MKRAAFVVVSLVGAVLAKASSAQVTQPFPGVTLVDLGDRALAIANLCAPGVSVRATKYEERDATPEQWATNPAVNADVAVNGDLFDFPGWTWVIGRARGDGEDWPASAQLYGGAMARYQYWQFGPGLANFVSPETVTPDTTATQIVGSHNTIIQNGVSLGPNFDGDATITGSYRRTAIGLSGARSTLYLFSSNTALTGSEMATSMLAMAAQGGAPDLDVATNEDGGGSSQMYVRGQGQIITSGRPVNNHLGIIASGSGASPMCWTRPPTMSLPPAPTECGLLKAPQGLGPGKTLTSCDGRFRITQQTNGDVVLFDPLEKPLWSTATAGLGYVWDMQGDGNLVDYSPYQVAYWQSGSAGHAGAYLAMQNDGNAVVYDGSTVLWTSATSDPTAPAMPTMTVPPVPTACGRIDAGHGLGLGDSIRSCDNRFKLAMQSDGNTVIEDANGHALWSTATGMDLGYTTTMAPAGAGYVFVMQGDGNLVVYTPYGVALWNAMTAGHPGAYLAVQDDGNLVVYDGATALWNSATVDPNAPPAQSQALDAGSAADGGVGVAGADGSTPRGPTKDDKTGGCNVGPAGPTGSSAVSWGLSLLVAFAGLERRRRST